MGGSLPVLHRHWQAAVHIPHAMAPASESRLRARRQAADPDEAGRLNRTRRSRRGPGPKAVVHARSGRGRGADRRAAGPP